MAYVLDNNVQCTLNTAINAVVTSIIVNAAVVPNKNPVAPSGGNTGVITLMDSLVAPTLIEIVTYATSTNNGNGTFTLTGCTRGQEGTTASSFAPGAACIGALTAAILAALVPSGNSTLLQFCGDGVDGDATISTSITLTADKYYRNLTMAAGGTINTGGYAVYVSGVLDLQAAIAGCFTAPSGAAGSSGGAGGVGAIGFTVQGGTNGGAGGALNSSGSNGLNATAANGGAGGAGESSVGAGGVGASYSSTSKHDIRRPGAPFLFGSTFISGGLGGAGGGGSATVVGGGGGGGGGGLVVYAGTIVTSSSSPSGMFRSTAGAGAFVASAGGGGGGGGGPIIIGYGTKIGPTIGGAIQSFGGNGGGGGACKGGGSGAVHVYNLLTGVAGGSGPSNASASGTAIVLSYPL